MFKCICVKWYICTHEFQSKTFWFDKASSYISFDTNCAIGYSEKLRVGRAAATLQAESYIKISKKNLQCFTL